MSPAPATADDPWLLPGGELELPGRGTTFVRHHPAPSGAPTVLLLHGLGATADANWFPAYPAGFSLARYDASGWIGGVDVPHAVVITSRDAAVAPARQARLAAALPAASVHPADIDHTGCVTRPALFVPALLAAIETVAEGQPIS